MGTVMATTIDRPMPRVLLAPDERRESYTALVWRKFRTRRIAIVGGVIIIMMIFMAIFADFLSPSDPIVPNMQYAYTSPQGLYFITADGQLSLRPFTFTQKQVLDPTTFLPSWQPDLTKPYPIRFFVQGYPYKLFGLFPSKLHLYGVDTGGTIFLLGSDKFGRDILGRISMAARISLSLSLVATLIIIAVGATIGITSGYYGGWVDNLIQRFIEFIQSFPALPLWMALAAVIPITWDQKLIFVAMSVIFALVSWGTMMREAQSLQTLGSNPWLMWPAFFIVLAVVGFNFMGDGLRDAVDPYSIV